MKESEVLEIKQEARLLNGRPPYPRVSRLCDSWLEQAELIKELRYFMQRMPGRHMPNPASGECYSDCRKCAWLAERASLLERSKQ